MVAWSAIIPAVASLASTGMSMFGGKGDNGAVDIAREQYAGQQALQQIIMQQQREMATAGQTDSLGNKLVYDPRYGWVTHLSPEGLTDQARSRAAEHNEAVRYFGTGSMERDREFNRRQAEGATASPLLTAIREGYGAPTKESVVGANKIAGVTAATEPADAIRSGANMAQLRTGTGSIPLGKSLSDLDRSATGGVRTALARADAEGGPLFNQIQSDFVAGKLNPYDKLASRASNIDNVAMPSTNTTSTLDTNLLQRAVRGGATQPSPYAGIGAQQGANALIAALGAKKQTPWGAGIGALGDIGKMIAGMFENSPGYHSYGEINNNIGSIGGMTPDQYGRKRVF